MIYARQNLKVPPKLSSEYHAEHKWIFLREFYVVIMDILAKDCFAKKEKKFVKRHKMGNKPF